MKVFLLKDIEKVGLSGEVINIKEGFAVNFLFPRKLAVKITPANEPFYQSKMKTVENRKEVLSSKTSQLSEKIKALKLTMKKKMHDDNKLYAAISAMEITDLLDKEGVKVAKSQVVFDKAIKTQGTFEVTIKLSNQLQPKFTLKIVAE